MQEGSLSACGILSSVWTLLLLIDATLCAGKPGIGEVAGRVGPCILNQGDTEKIPSSSPDTRTSSPLPG